MSDCESVPVCVCGERCEESASKSSRTARGLPPRGVFRTIMASDFPPTCVAPSKEMARRDTGTRIDASEYMDSSDVLDAKVSRLAAMIQSSTLSGGCAYTGAGLSTSAGIGDYASKAKKSAALAWDPHTGGGPHKEHLKEAKPTAAIVSLQGSSVRACSTSG